MSITIETAKHRSEIYAVAKREGIELTAEIKKTLNLGGLRDHVRSEIAAKTPGTPEWKIATLKGMTAEELVLQMRRSVQRVEAAQPLSDVYWEAAADQTLSERELLRRLG